MYKIICFTESFLGVAVDKVQNAVELLKINGWVEQGGVSVSSQGVDGNYVVAQAMVKKNDK